MLWTFYWCVICLLKCKTANLYIPENIIFHGIFHVLLRCVFIRSSHALVDTLICCTMQHCWPFDCSFPAPDTRTHRPRRSYETQQRSCASGSFVVPPLEWSAIKQKYICQNLTSDRTLGDMSINRPFSQYVIHRCYCVQSVMADKRDICWLIAWPRRTHVYIGWGEVHTIYGPIYYGFIEEYSEGCIICINRTCIITKQTTATPSTKLYWRIQYIPGTLYTCIYNKLSNTRYST